MWNIVIYRLLRPAQRVDIHRPIDLHLTHTHPAQPANGDGIRKHIATRDRLVFVEKEIDQRVIIAVPAIAKRPAANDAPAFAGLFQYIPALLVYEIQNVLGGREPDPQFITGMPVHGIGPYTFDLIAFGLVIDKTARRIDLGL